MHPSDWSTSTTTPMLTPLQLGSGGHRLLKSKSPSHCVSSETLGSRICSTAASLPCWPLTPPFCSSWAAGPANKNTPKRMHQVKGELQKVLSHNYALRGSSGFGYLENSQLGTSLWCQLLQGPLVVCLTPTTLVSLTLANHLLRRAPCASIPESRATLGWKKRRLEWVMSLFSREEK